MVFFRQVSVISLFEKRINLFKISWKYFIKLSTSGTLYLPAMIISLEFSTLLALCYDFLTLAFVQLALEFFTDNIMY